MATFITITVMFLIVIIIVSRINRAKSGKTRIKGPVHRPNQTSKKKFNSIKPYENTPIPVLLGIQPHIPLKAAIDRMEQALANGFTEKLKARVIIKYPKMTLAEFEWKFLELKRYFLMTAVLKDVPMFSDAVDDIWHEMLMFTREYNKLGEALLGSPIHHAPHTGGQPDPEGRAWFDWVYANMFIQTPYSGRIWGAFFKHPLNREMIEEIKISGETELIPRGFNKAAVERYPEIRSTAMLLIRKAKEQAAGAVPGATYNQERPAFDHAAYMPYLAGALLFYSVTQLGSFDSSMEQHLSEEEMKQRAQEQAYGGSGGSSCSSNGSRDDDNRGDHDSSGDGGGDGGGNDSGGGSSSCSGCGGGGD
ncbi:hypothetical protein [Paenibacillus agricola]|uniref:Uncharacterized protein n=1 Tax=Paenibacillus agricola TaxID=2716264 RepID=A0ABX0IZI4_9BACL|nr:hypothetical protein [Paenibacillus agricola]NHN28971.1 hypothetical protein [Paenibacillus agricola]